MTTQVTSLASKGNVPPTLAFPETPVLLVDGDLIAYRCAAVAEKTKYCVTVGYAHGLEPYFGLFDSAKGAKEYANYHDEGGCDDIHIWSRKDLQPVEHALEAASSCLGAIASKWENSIVQVYISGDRNFRDGIWQTKKYKGNREQTKPTHLQAVREYLVSRWFALVSKNQEADDDIGIAASNESSAVIVSTDKDLDQIAGWHYDWVKEQVYYVNQADADQFLYEQTISGDSVDNIPGLPGFGPAKARKYLDARGDKSLHEATIELFRKEGFDYAYFHEMKSLCEILRKPR